MAILRRRVAKVPEEPGVYRWLDADGTVLYVGKAKNLRQRMRSYVQDGVKRSAWTEIMVRRIADFAVTVVRSELEAFLLESNLIKELRPKFNIMLKDDKNYVYVRVTKEQYPRVDIVRRVDDTARSFGPFTAGAKATEGILSMLDELIGFRACKASLDLLNEGKPVSGTPCLDQQIGKCNGLCIGAIDQEEYCRRIDEVERFFRSQYGSVKRIAEEQMRACAAAKKFERAARMRDAIRFIEDLEQRQIVSDASGEHVDVIGIATRGGRTQVVLLKVREGKVVGELSFALSGEADSAAEGLAQFLPQYYRETQDLPDAVVVSEEMTDAPLLATWLTERRGRSVRIIVPERGRKSHLLLMAEKNAHQKVEQQFAAWEAETKKIDGALAELQELLGLPSPPRRIEGYDISHLGGSATVGSMVVMIHGKPKREHYRSFNMQSVVDGAIDDYKSLAETLRRRLRYLRSGIKEQKAYWQSQGVVIGRAKKADQPVIEAIIQRFPGIIEPETTEYTHYVVARKNEEIIAFAGLYEDREHLLELDPVWVDDAYRGQRLGHVLIQSLLQKQKKKVYMLTKPALEEYYAELGFCVIRDVPQVLQQKIDDFVARYKQPAEIAMMIEPKKQKPDPSFVDRPDLLLIDGGKGQLGAVVDILKALQLDIPVASLAKREEEIFVPSQPEPLVVREGSEARFLLQRLRDEAHRFANDRRARRLKSAMTQSILDEVPGIGEATKIALLKTFGSAERVIAASDEALREVLSEGQLKSLRELYP